VLLPTTTFRVGRRASRLPDGYLRSTSTPGLPRRRFHLRTVGGLHPTGFMLWQSAETEGYGCDIFWAGFRRIDFLRAIRSYSQRRRRCGQEPDTRRPSPARPPGHCRWRHATKPAVRQHAPASHSNAQYGSVMLA